MNQIIKPLNVWFLCCWNRNQLQNLKSAFGHFTAEMLNQTDLYNNKDRLKKGPKENESEMFILRLIRFESSGSWASLWLLEETRSFGFGNNKHKKTRRPLVEQHNLWCHWLYSWLTTLNVYGLNMRTSEYKALSSSWASEDNADFSAEYLLQFTSLTFKC